MVKKIEYKQIKYNHFGHMHRFKKKKKRRNVINLKKFKKIVGISNYWHQFEIVKKMLAKIDNANSDLINCLILNLQKNVSL